MCEQVIVFHNPLSIFFSSTMQMHQQDIKNKIDEEKLYCRKKINRFRSIVKCVKNRNNAVNTVIWKVTMKIRLHKASNLI